MGPGALVATVWLVAWLVVLSVVDARTRRLPDRMVLALLVGLVVADAADGVWSGRPAYLLWACAGACAYGTALLLVRLVAPSGIGGGDVKLALPLGWQLGYETAGGIATAVPAAILVACAGALAFRAATVLAGRRGGRHLAFGPWMGVGALLVLALS